MEENHAVRRVALETVLALVFLIVARVASAQGPVELPIALKAKVDAARIAETGRFSVALEFTPDEIVGRALIARIGLFAGDRVLVVRDHHPTPPSKTWKKSKPVLSTAQLVYPLDAGVAPGDPLAIGVLLIDAATRETFYARGALGYVGGMAYVAALEAPSPPPIDQKRIAALIEAALKTKSDGRPADGWNMIESAIRMTDSYPLKLDLRDGLLKVGLYEPAPLSGDESRIVADRIEAERRRFLRQVAGRMHDAGKLHGALRILEAIGGKLEEEADQAVIGALDAAKRAESDRQDLKQKLLERIGPEEKAAADADIKKFGPTERLYERAEERFRKKEWPIGLRILRELSLIDAPDLKKKAQMRRVAAEKEFVAATPDAEMAEVDRAMNHPAFARTKTAISHKFVYIGPEGLLAGMPAESKLRFDAAYVYLTDLFGRLPNPGGDRVTVYFKELWEFGGGVGGGTTIDIGSADPRAKETRLDNGLMYHELTHCVDDTNPIFPGHREGLANFGAAFCFEMIGQKGDSFHSISGNLEAFRRDYLARDLEYWRIQNYGPSAGFFLHFIEKYGKTADGHDWKKYRDFFRSWRSRPVKDSRWPYLARGLAHELMKVFGDGAFDDLLTFRFPLEPSDKAVLAAEDEVYCGRGGIPSEADAEESKGSPNSSLGRDARGAELSAKARGKDEAGTKAAAERLGVVRTWRCIGPFTTDEGDPEHFVFPPETGIDFQARYPFGANVCEWRIPAPGQPATIDASGWVRFEYGYQANSAIYALSYVTVPEAAKALLHLRFDDAAAVFLNDRLIDHFESSGVNGDSWLWWRGPCSPVPDSVRAPILLRKGRNKLLVKIKNESGAAGFILALSKPDGSPLEGLVAETDQGDDARRVAAPTDGWIKKKQSFADRGNLTAIEVAAGKFGVRRKALAGEATDRSVGWRKYTVRPGFPKDSPSNLFWLKSDWTKGTEEFELALDLATPDRSAPKLAVTFQGDGTNDGLSGWTIILHDAGADGVQARLERYDRLVVQSAVVRPKRESQEIRLVVRVVDDLATVRLGDATLFEATPINEIPGKDRIGVSLWGPDTLIAGLEFAAPKRK